LTGLSAVLLAAGSLLIIAGCGTRSQVSVIPPDVGTAPPSSVPAPSSGSPVTITSPRKVPVRIVIPAIGVDAPVMQLGLNPDRTIQVPPLADPNLAGWYKYGPAPGQIGPAVIVGHIDSVASGGEVFYKLRYLVRGDKVVIYQAGGGTVTYVVDGLQQVPKTAFPTRSVYGSVPYPALRLVTCGGVFNPATHSYESNVIVYGHLV